MWHQKPFSLSWSDLSHGGIKWNQDWYRKNAEAVCYFSLSWLCLSFVFLLIFKVILNFFIFWTINPYLLFSSFDLSVHLLSCSVTQSCPTLCNPMDCSLPGSSVHVIFQAKILEWVAISSSREICTWLWSINCKHQCPQTSQGPTQGLNPHLSVSPTLHVGSFPPAPPRKPVPGKGDK